MVLKFGMGSFVTMILGFQQKIIWDSPLHLQYASFLGCIRGVIAKSCLWILKLGIWPLLQKILIFQSNKKKLGHSLPSCTMRYLQIVV